MGLMGAAMATKTASGRQTPQTPGAPPAFGTSAAVGPKVDAETFAVAEKLVQVEMSAKDRAEAAGNWQQSMAAAVERRVGPRKIAIGYEDVPATVWHPEMPVVSKGALPEPKGSEIDFGSHEVTDSGGPEGPPLPVDDAAIAFASIVDLGRWIAQRKLSSVRLTKIYLERLKKYQPTLNCVITLCEEHALEQARKVDLELAMEGRLRGPLHGIPWGAKDLLDTAGIKTSWGAEPFRDRVPVEDATVTKRLNEAGAVLVAKLSLGALALNDVWFGGQTKNPWNLDEGASGSSAGPGAAVAAGLVGFAIGSETQGSIVSPSMRCGVTGLRPTFGRVPRTGAMALSWSCDKLGPMARHVEDTMLVLQAISGPDGKDVSCVPQGNGFAMPGAGKNLKVGYFPKWMQEAPATEVDRAALETVKKLGMELVEVSLPDWPYDSLNVILFAESAAAFEEITLNHQVDELTMQTPDAWPNTFRQSRFLSAVDFVQADRLRRKVAVEFAKVMAKVDVLLVPSLRDEFLVITNFTGHPSLTLRAGFVEVSEERSDWAPDAAKPLKKFSPPRRVPHGVTLVGQLFGEGTTVAAGIALEQAFGVAAERPKGF
jgi:Asp-tRNA(Asn)/Glu-tRNA(Gln) amidotransferase A subunit family amidase